MRELLLNDWFGPRGVPTGLLPDLTSRFLCATDNWWRHDVTHAPRDPNSAALIQMIHDYTSDAPNGRLSTDFGATGIPYCGVAGSTPLVTVRVGGAPQESDPGPNGWSATGSGWKESAYPIPVEAQSNLSYIELGGSLNGDRHLLVLDVDNWILYEFSYVRWGYTYQNSGYTALPGKWGCGYAAKWDLKGNTRRTEGFTSTDAAGLAVLPGLIRYDELLDAASIPLPIQHALRFAVPYALATYCFPASHAAHSGSVNDPADVNGMPMGLRLRLKPTVNFGSLGITNIYSKKLFLTMQTFGILLADRCGHHNNMIFQGTYDTRWADNGLFDIINADFHKLFVTDFEVIQLGWAPPGAKPTREIIMST